VARVEVGKRNYRTVEGTAISECPVSYITAQSLQLLAMIHDDMIAHEATGGTLFGPVSGRWPAWWLDAVATVRGEINREHNMRMEAMK